MHRHRTGGRERPRGGAARPDLVGSLIRQLPGVRDTVPPAAKVAGSAHVMFEDVESEAVLFLLDDGESVRVGGVGVCERSDGSVARARRDGLSPVRRARGALRMSLGRTTTAADVDRAPGVLTDAVTTLRTRRAAMTR